MIRRLGFGRVLLFLLGTAVVTIVVVALISRNDDSKKCVDVTVSDATDTTTPNADAFAVFIAEQEEGPLPLDGWAMQSESGDRSTYVSTNGGNWHVDVARGAIRSYGGCPA